MTVGGHAMMVGGTRVPYLRNSAFEARRVAGILSEATGFVVEAVGLVALVGARRLTVRERPRFDDVAVGVCTARDLLSTISPARRYSEEWLRLVVDAAVRPETWQASLRVEADVRGLSARLDELGTRSERYLIVSSTGLTARSSRRGTVRVPAAPSRRSGARTRSRRRSESRIEDLVKAIVLLGLGLGALVWLRMHGGG